MKWLDFSAGQRAVEEQRLKEKREIARDAHILAECFGIEGEKRNATQQAAYDRFRKMSGYDTPCFIIRDGSTDPCVAAYYDGCRQMFRSMMDFIKNNVNQKETDD